MIDDAFRSAERAGAIEELKIEAAQAQTESRAAQLRAKLLTRDEVIKRPPPESLVDRLLFRSTLALLYGKPKSYKSFLALDLALSIASGRRWGDRTTAQGPVIYVAAEGLAGLGKRLQAWEQAYGHLRQDGDGFHVLPEVVRLLQAGDVGALVELAVDMRPALVVLDTLNRCLVGGDENNSRDMGQAIDAADQIRQTGSTVLIVHHADKAGRNYRGHSSLEGAVDTVLKLERIGKTITLTSEAQKDAAEADPISLRTTRQEVDSDTSLVLYCHEGVGSIDDETGPDEAALLDLLGSTFGSNGASSSQLLKTSDMADRTFYRSLKRLVERGLISNAGTPNRTRYVVVSKAEQGVLP
jgi:hypothetical protein